MTSLKSPPPPFALATPLYGVFFRERNLVGGEEVKGEVIVVKLDNAEDFAVDDFFRYFVKFFCEDTCLRVYCIQPVSS